MADVTIIGRGANVVGRVSGAIDLEIHGRVEGDVAVDGDVTVEAQGLVSANVAGRRVIIRGAVKGDVSGEDAVRLEEGARVVGDIHAPRIAITRGALVRGHVQTSGSESESPRGRAPLAAARPAPASREVASRQAVPVPTRKISAAGAPAPLLVADPPAKVAAKGPPPPVVPVLKKGAKGALKKKAG
jgi:cytoskeletal protein CcmA (bactofilin family)